MRPEVVSYARDFQTRFEGRCAFMYIDALGLVTTAIGNLIDSPDAAARLPWRCCAGMSAASDDMIRAEWTYVKSRQDMRSESIEVRQSITRLLLTEEAVNALFDAETARVWGQIVGGYPDAEQWPAPAQLATLSMCWAMGAGRIVPGASFCYPHLRSALLAQAWGIAAQECRMNGTGIEARNAADKALFQRAAAGNPSLVVY